MAIYSVDIVPELDITGNFKRLKDVNRNVSEKLIYNQLITIINMRRGFNPWFPELGLADIIHRIPFNDTFDVGKITDELESEVRKQTNSECSVKTKIGVNSDNSKYVDITFYVNNLTYGVTARLNQNDPNIRVINPDIIKEL